jgi:hypothetical protein
MSQPDQQKKNEVIEYLKKVPLVQVASDKAGISRSTYYRWRHDDPQFMQDTDEAIKDGSLLVNDLAEGSLINAIKDQNLGAIIFWLKNRHSSFGNKLELAGKLQVENTNLSPEEETEITRALKMFGYKNGASNPLQAPENNNI